MDQLPQLPDLVIASDIYEGKARLLARIPYGNGHGEHAIGWGETGGVIENFAINAANFVVLTDVRNGRLHIVGPEGQYYGSIEELWDIAGPVVFTSDSICEFQVGHRDVEGGQSIFFSFPLGETVVTANIFTRSVIGNRAIPAPKLDGSGSNIEDYLPEWHPINLLHRLDQGVSDFPPMQYRIGSSPIWEVADPGPGRGFFKRTTRSANKQSPGTSHVYGPYPSFCFFEDKVSKQRYYIDATLGSVRGQTIDGRIYVSLSPILGFERIGNEFALTEKYGDPPLAEATEIGGGPRVSPSGRVIWIYRTSRGIEIYKAENKKS